MDMPTPERLAADLRTNRILWFAIAMGVVLLTVVMVYLVQSQTVPPSQEGDLFFYLSALFSMGAIGIAFWFQRGLTEALPRVGTYEEAAMLIRSRGLVGIALMEGSALFAAVAYMLTGDAINLAFVLPFFAFWALFFPTEARYRYLLAHAMDERG